MKKTISTFFVLWSLLTSFVNIGNARLGRQDYWNKYEKDQNVPEEIKNMFTQDPLTPFEKDLPKKHQNLVKNFDPRRFDAVVYHTHNTKHKIGNKALDKLQQV